MGMSYEESLVVRRIDPAIPITYLYTAYKMTLIIVNDKVQTGQENGNELVVFTARAAQLGTTEGLRSLASINHRYMYQICI
jgi:hypothetical protein